MSFTYQQFNRREHVPRGRNTSLDRSTIIALISRNNVALGSLCRCFPRTALEQKTQQSSAEKPQDEVVVRESHKCTQPSRLGWALAGTLRQRGKHICDWWAEAGVETLRSGAK
uniref:Uncharacterized protein n=1 Tax=Plectus sambesii TaxID=2011161 RepID=A0A914WPX2_9BILA